MLKTEEIQRFINDDIKSPKKILARKGQAYYDGDHDIKDYRLFYFNSDGNLVEDKARSNIKIAHPFFMELVDQAVQYILSGSDGFIKSDLPELQGELDSYFNKSEDFTAELSETLTGCIAKGFEYMYAYKNKDDKLAFMCADSIGVVEVEAKLASDNKEHIIYWYIDRTASDGKKVKKIMDWDEKETRFYVQESGAEIKEDASQKVNPRPHTLYTKEGDQATYYESFDFIPFFRLDNNKKQVSGLKAVKDVIDDYDLMASSLSNNLVDFDTPIHVVKGYQSDNLDELQKNLKTKKIIGVDSEGDVEIRTIDVPYEARKIKLELDEKNIYRFGMGLNTVGLKDTTATTNVAIKAAYSLLDLKCSKLEIRLKQFLRKIIKVVLEEINKKNDTNYQLKDIYFDFKHEIMSNAHENAEIGLTEAQKRQIEINTILSLANTFNDETILQLLCEQLDIDYEEIKEKIPEQEELGIAEAQTILDGVAIDGPKAERNIAVTTG